jgi:4-amino-4-deoxy-L-arabinose transferase-like glycosyltransferase
MSSPDESVQQQHSSASSLRWAVTVAAVIVWLFVVVAAYFWAHKPFDANIVAGLGRSLLSISVWLGLTWLGTALGRRIAGGPLADEAPIVRIALGAGLGLGLLSLLTLGLGLVGLLRSAVAWGAILVLAALLRRDLRASLADLRAVVRGQESLLAWPTDGFRRWLAVYVGASLLLAFLAALAPPTAWDALVYHLAGPALFVEAGRVGHPVDLPYLGFPQLGEMGFTLGMLLLGDGVASLLHFGYGLLGVIITGALARRAFGQAVAWPAAALLLSVPSLVWLMSRAYVDVTLLFYATVAFYAFTRWRNLRAGGEAESSIKWLSLMGVFCGFSAGVKYTALAIPVALSLGLLWTSRHDGLRAVVWRIAQFGGITAAVALPWLMENWLTTGNPVYPFFLYGVHWDAWRAWWYDRPGTGLAVTAPWRLLIAPLEATVLGTEGGEPYDATIGPLLLALTPLLIVTWPGLKREERAVAGHMLLFFGVNYGLWLVGLARSALLVQTRLLLPIFGVVAVLGAVALDRLTILRRSQLAVDWIARAVVSLALALLLFSNLITFLQVNPMPVIAGLEGRDDYLSRRLGTYQLAMRTVNALPPDSRVVFLWEPRSYACQVDCRPDALLDRFLHLTHLYPDAGSIAKAWREEGVTHVLLYRLGLQAIIEDKFDPVTSRDLAILEELQVSEMEEVGRLGESYILYRLRPTGGDE